MISEEFLHLLTILISGKGALVRMQNLLTKHVEGKGSGMYEIVGTQLKNDLTEMTKEVKFRLVSAAKEAQKRICTDIDGMIFMAGPEGREKFRKGRSLLQGAVQQLLQASNAALANDLQDAASQLAAANPFTGDGSSTQLCEDNRDWELDSDNDKESVSDSDNSSYSGEDDSDVESQGDDEEEDEKSLFMPK